jgi:hypothetical protein
MIHVTTFATRQLVWETIIDELQVLPELLRKAEKQYYKAQNTITEKRDKLADLESELVQTPVVGIHSEAARLAAARPFTGPLLTEIREAQVEADLQKAEVDFLLRRLANYHLMAKLLTNP